MGLDSDDYYDSLGEDVNFGEAPVNMDEHHVQEVFQENIDEAVREYMDMWKEVHDLDEDTIEYQQAMIDFQIELEEYVNLNQDTPPEMANVDIVGFISLMRNDIGHCPFDNNPKKNLLYNITPIKNQDNLCLIHALKTLTSTNANAQQRLNLIIKEVNKNPNLFDFSCEREYVTKVADMLDVTITVFSDIKCQQIAPLDRLFPQEAEFINNKHYFSSKHQLTNDLLYTDYFKSSTTYGESSSDSTQNLRVFKIAQYSQQHGTKFHYEAINDINKSFCFTVKGSNVRAYSISKVLKPRVASTCTYQYKLTQQCHIQINQESEEEIVKRIQAINDEVVNNVTIQYTFNQPTYAQQCRKRVIAYSLSNRDANNQYVASLDFETIITRGKAQIYSFSFVVISRDANKSDVDNYLTFFEINHHPDDQKQQQILEQKILIIMQTLCSFLKADSILTYTFNGRKFDHVILLEIIQKFKLTGFLIEKVIGNHGQKVNLKQSVTIVNGGIQKMSFMGCMTILDIKLLLGLGTLSDQCKNFKVQSSKLFFNHYKVQEFYDANKHICMPVLLDERIENYNNIDCISVVQIHEKLEFQLLDAINNALEADFLSVKDHGVITQKIKCGSFFTCGQIILAIQEASQKNPMPTQKGLQYSQQKFTFGGEQFNFDDYNWIRRSCVGGRTQAFSPGIIEDTICGQDFVSLYPSVQLDPNNFYPCGEIKTYQGESSMKQYRAQVINKQRLAIAEITLHEQTSTHCIFPVREENGRLNWLQNKPNGAIIVVTSVELNKAISLGYKFTMTRCFIWQDKINGRELFRTLQMFFDKKQEQDKNKQEDEQNQNTPGYIPKTNNAMRQIMKILCNSLYGKMMQKIFQTKCVYVGAQQQDIDEALIKNVKSLGNGMLQQELFMGAKQIEKQMKPVWIASFVYSYSRMQLFNCFLDEPLAKAGFRPLYCDTDSCFYQHKFMSLVKDHLEQNISKTIWHDGKGVAQLGQLTQEMQDGDKPFKDCRAIIISPKFYVFMSRDGDKVHKKGAKGMHYQSDIILTKEIRVMLDAFMIQQQVKTFAEFQEAQRKFFMWYKKEYVHGGVWCEDAETQRKQLKAFEEKQVKQLIKYVQEGAKSLEIMSMRLTTSLIERNSDGLRRKLDACSINNIVIIKNIKFDV